MLNGKGCGTCEEDDLIAGFGQHEDMYPDQGHDDFAPARFGMHQDMYPDEQDDYEPVRFGMHDEMPNVQVGLFEPALDGDCRCRVACDGSDRVDASAPAGPPMSEPVDICSDVDCTALLRETGNMSMAVEQARNNVDMWTKKAETGNAAFKYLYLMLVEMWKKRLERLEAEMMAKTGTLFACC